MTLSPNEQMEPSGMTNQSSPILSILIPSYNAGPFLREAIESALADSRVELIIQDALSDDETPQVLRQYENDTRVLMIREHDFGQSDALNRALSRATGNWIGWLNADDVYTKDSLQFVLEAIEAGAADGFSVLYGDFQLIDHAGITLRKYRVSPWSWNRIFHRGCYVFSGATFIKREELERVGGLDTTLHYCMDLDLFLKLGPEVRSRKLQKTLGALRIHRGSKTYSRGRQFAREALRVRRRYRHGLLALAISIRAYLYSHLYVTFQPIRFSRAYSRFRQVKNL
jgi:glycosyltransferase involved in cell wall biosynthesis